MKEVSLNYAIKSLMTRPVPSDEHVSAINSSGKRFEVYINFIYQAEEPVVQNCIVGLSQNYMHHKYLNKPNCWTCNSFHEKLKPNRSIIDIYKYTQFFQKNVVFFALLCCIALSGIVVLFC